MRSERWSTSTRDLTLPERVAWVLGNEEGRPLSSLTEPAGLLVSAALVELLLDASVLDGGTTYRRGPVDPADPLLGWFAEGLLRGGGRKSDLGHAVSGPRGAQMIRHTMDRLVDRGLAHREPRRVFGYLAMPVFGSSLRVHETVALHHDRAVVREVLDGADPDEDTALITVLLHHGRRIRALHPRDPQAAASRARAIASGWFLAPGIARDVVRLVSPTVQAVLASLAATEVLSSGR